MVAAKNWTLEQLKAELTRAIAGSELKGWIVTQEHVHRRERYFMSGLKDGMIVDQDRDTHRMNVHVKLFVPLAKPGRQGEISKQFFPAIDLREQLRSAIEAAKQTDHQAWELPSAVAQSDIPNTLMADPRIAEDVEGVMEELTKHMGTAVRKPRKSKFNSAELFLSMHDREVHFSNGLSHRFAQSRIYAESAFSFANQGNSDEYLSTTWAVGMGDLSIETLFDETAERAERSLDVVKPAIGRYPVIVDSEVLGHLFNDQCAQMTATHAYQGLPFLKPGDEMIPSATGDLISISLDPCLELGAGSLPLSDQGLLQRPLRLVERNRVVTTATDKQYADYLGFTPSTAKGNVVVEPGALSYAELTRSSPLVLEILQFSGLFTDPISGTFSSEIRLARLHDNASGKVTYVKGGSLSGSIKENFRGIRLSNNRIKRNFFSSEKWHGTGYFGPDFALLSDVSVVG